MEKSSKIFVAGGTGMVGSAIIRRLLSLGYTSIISNYYKRKYVVSNLQPLTSSVTFVQLDLEHQADVEAFFKQERPKYVFLAAAKVGGIYANNTYPADFIYNNLMIQTCILHSAYLYDVKKLLFLGSSCIYPKLAPQPIKEEYLLSGPLEPTNEPYAVAKIAGIKMCQAYNRQYGTNFISVMPTNLYGPNDNYDLMDSHVLPALIRKFHLAKLLSESKFDEIIKDFQIYGNMPECLLPTTYYSSNPDHLLPTAYSLVLGHLSKFGLKGGGSLNSNLSPQSSSDSLSASDLHPFASNVIVELWGSGNAYREFLHVDDLADACVFLMENYDCKDIGEFVNIGSGMDLKVRELADIIKTTVGYEGEIKWDKTKPDGTPRKLLDVSRMTNFGWKSNVPLEQGIKKTYQWYCSALNP
jgi:GDP-L-fucose synthase